MESDLPHNSVTFQLRGIVGPHDLRMNAEPYLLSVDPPPRS